MARKKEQLVEDSFEENVSIEPLENVMGDRYATYAKYVIQDRAIPDVRDGLKPVQRRIIFTMHRNNNSFNKPTRKCAHTVGAVMGTFHPHGDTSIYEALARMSQDWKLRYPLIDFQGNNGSIDGDSPAAYRYTESRLSELSNELVKDIEKKTVDMQLNFDDTEFEPTVLPSRFPNLLVNGTEGIAVALATEIPPHNMNEVIDATVYRINHKNANNEELMQFVKGPDFPNGGQIYESEGLKNIYLTGKGRIEVSSKIDVVHNKDNIQLVINEIPYKVVKSQLVYEIDRIIHSKSINGLIEIRDESDWNGIRIVIDLKKDSKVDVILNYLLAKTPLLTSYNANMVAIVNGRPKTLTLIDFIDAYIDHQVDVVTRSTKFDLEKNKDRLHIVEGLIIASVNISEVVDIIRKSKDKSDSKINLMNRFNLTAEQAEAIVTMPLYKLSHTDEQILLNERKQLIENIELFEGILNDQHKLNKVIIKELNRIKDKYGDERRTQIVDKPGVKPIDKRDLVIKELVMIAASKDGYIKRSSLKSAKSGGEISLPGLKAGDVLVSMSEAYTTDYLICFTSMGNYLSIPIHEINETRWKDEGIHLNSFSTLSVGEKIVKSIIINSLRKDIFLVFLTKFGQIKRMSVSSIELNRRSRLTKCMKLLNSDELIRVVLTNGNNNLLITTLNGVSSYFNENELTVLGNKAGGVKAIGNASKNPLVNLLSFEEDDKIKAILISNKGHYRIIDSSRFNLTSRLGKTFQIMPCFKNDIHQVVSIIKNTKKLENMKINLYLSDESVFEFNIDDFHLSDITKNAKQNIDLPRDSFVLYANDVTIELIDDKMVSKYCPQDKKPTDLVESIETPNVTVEEENETDSGSFEQISIFDDLDE